MRCDVETSVNLPVNPRIWKFAFVLLGQQLKILRFLREQSANHVIAGTGFTVANSASFDEHPLTDLHILSERGKAEEPGGHRSETTYRQPFHFILQSS